MVLCVFTVTFGQLSTYTFSQNAGTYSDITGTSGEVILGTTANDEQVFFNTTGTTTFTGGVASGTGFSLGFNFSYNGATYTNFAVHTNGFIVLGTGTFNVPGITTGFTTPISGVWTGSTNAISAWSKDLQGTATSSLSYVVTGSVGSRILTVQWKNYQRFSVGGSFYNMQIKLFETTNVVQTVYGSMTPNTTSTTAANTRAQVGLRGAVNTDFNNRSITTTETWATSLNGATNTAYCMINNTIRCISSSVQ